MIFSPRKLVSNLDYFVTVNGRLLDPKVYTSPNDNQFQSSNVPVCACAATSVYYVNVSGSLTWSSAHSFGDELLKQGRFLILFTDFGGFQVHSVK